MRKIVSIFLATVMMASSVVMAFAKPILKGDTNDDEMISAVDARNILMAVVGIKTIDDTQKVYYDVDSNGEITATDARMVLRITAGLEDPIVEESTTEEPTTEEPTTEEPATEESTTEEPTTEEPTIEESTTEESTTEEPTTEINPEEERMMTLLETEFLKLVNEERVKNGRGELTVNETLHKAARLRAIECFEKFSHTRPNGQSYESILQGDLKYDWIHIGENIAWEWKSPYSTTDWTKILTDEDMKAYANRFFNTFKTSSVHYKNMLYSDFTETGFGVAIVITKDGTLKIACSQLFGTPA